MLTLGPGVVEGSVTGAEKLPGGAPPYTPTNAAASISTSIRGS
jgi:hypothetical protein